jgi:hypothetical protein
MQFSNDGKLSMACPSCGIIRKIDIPEQFQNWPDAANQLWMSVAKTAKCTSCEKSKPSSYSENIQRAEKEARLSEWNAFCPPMYRKTDVSHPGLNTQAFRIVMSHDFSDSSLLVIEGSKRNGKSRAAFFKVKEDYLRGKTVDLVQGCNFRSYVKELSNLSADDKQAKVKQPYFLLLDDIQDSLIASSNSDWLLFELNTILKIRQTFERKTIAVMKSPPSKTSAEIKSNYQKIREFLDQYADLTIDFDS